MSSLAIELLPRRSSPKFAVFDLTAFSCKWEASGDPTHESVVI